MAKGGSGLAAPDWKARRSPVNTGAPQPAPKVAQARVLEIQRKLHKWAKDDQDRRFSDLHNLVCDPATLMVAWTRVRANRGSRSAGVDGQSAAYVEQVLGVQRFLTELREELREGSYRPLPVRERMIPKRGGKVRRLGIPTVTAYREVVHRAFGFAGGDASVSPAGGGAAADLVRAPLGGLAPVCVRGRAAGQRDAARGGDRPRRGSGWVAADGRGARRARRGGGRARRGAGGGGGSLMLCANQAQADERVEPQRVEHLAVAVAAAAPGAGGRRPAGDAARDAQASGAALRPGRVPLRAGRGARALSVPGGARRRERAVSLCAGRAGAGGRRAGRGDRAARGRAWRDLADQSGAVAPAGAWVMGGRLDGRRGAPCAGEHARGGACRGRGR